MGAMTPPACWPMRGRRSGSRTTPPARSSKPRPSGRRCTPWARWLAGRWWHGPVFRSVARGVRRWRSSRSWSSPPRWAVHRVRAPLPVACGRGVLPAPEVLGAGRVRGGAGVAARVHRRAHDLPVIGGGGVRGREGGAVRAQHRAGAAGAADRGGQGQVRPRRRPRPNCSRRLRPATSTSPSPRSAPPGPCTWRATSTWPTPSTSTPPSPLTPTSSCCSARPSPSTSAAPARPETSPEPADPRPGRIQQNHPPEAAGGAARPPRATPPSWVRVDWPGSRRPAARSPPSRSASGAATPTPGSRSSRSWTSPTTSMSAPTKRGHGSGSRPSSATTPASSRSAVAPPRGATATTESPHADDGADLQLQPGPCLSAPPPRQDHRRLDLRHRRTRHLPVAQPARLPVPPRPHRHPRHHPRPRTPSTGTRVPPPLRRTLTTPPRTPLNITPSGGVGMRPVSAGRDSRCGFYADPRLRVHRSRGCGAPGPRRAGRRAHDRGVRAGYYDDMYVDADLQLDTARRVGNVRAWVTSEYEHDGLRADRPRVVGRLNGHARRRGLADGRLARRVRGPLRR